MLLHNLPIFRVLCWTLLHSLWQGLLLAVAGAIIILVTKKSSAAFRYNCLLILFFAFVAGAFCTLVLQGLATENHLQSGSAASEQAVNFFKTQATSSSYGREQDVDLPLSQNIINYLDQHASLIVIVWFIFFSIQFIRLAGRTGYVYYIRHYRIHKAPDCWKSKLFELSGRLGIRQPIELLRSELVRTPVTVGFIKPVILFPFSLLLNMPPDQIEAVLLHELAHIRRRDYFVNLVQSVTEIIFFFNPGLRWISAMMRDERENCCDDIAIGKSANKKQFVHALIAFQEMGFSDSICVTGFTGRKYHLLNRIKRLLTNNNKTLNTMEKISLAVSILIISLVTVAFTQSADQTIARKQVMQQPQPIISIRDTIPAPKDSSTKSTYVSRLNGTYVARMDGREYKLIELNGNVSELYIDNKRIPQSEMKKYAGLIEKIRARQQEDMEKLSHDALRLATLRAILEAEREKLNDQLAQLNEDNAARRIKRMAEADALKEQSEAFRAAGDSGSIAQLKEQQAKLLAERQDMESVQKTMETIRSQKESLEQEDKLRQENAMLQAKLEEMRIQQEIENRGGEKLDKKQYEKAADSLQRKILQQLKEAQLRIEQEKQFLNEMRSRQHDAALMLSHENDLANLGKLNGLRFGLPDEASLSQLKDPEQWKPLCLVINDLVAEHLITTTDNLSIRLNDKVLEVNGAAQPEGLHSKLKEKYLRQAKDHIIYSKQGNSEHADISIGKDPY